jgi:RNA polymerase sigma factor (sigma-70 family)
LSPPILDPIRGALLRSQPDGRLVALAREGRERAIEEIVRRYRAPLVAFAAMIVPAHRADDVVQDSLLRAIDALGSSDAEIQLRPWLFRIVRNQALNDLRDTPTHDELGAELEGVASPDEIAERREEIAALVGGLRALPDAQREAIVARELEGRGHSEIAAELGTSPGAVRQLIFRARSTLRGAAGLLVPLPLLRLLLGPGSAEAAGAAATAGVAAAAGGGAATGVAGKVAVGLAGVAVAVGGGIAAERSRDGADGVASAEERAGGGGAGSTSSGLDGGGYGAGGARSVLGPGDTGGSSHGGSGGSGSGGGERSGPGGGDGSGQGEDTDDSSGSGSSGSSDSGSGSSGSGSSGSGSGGDFHQGDLDEDEFVEPDKVEPDEVEDEPETSGSSGSGSSGSGSSGSGSSGSSDQLDPNDLN